MQGNSMTTSSAPLTQSQTVQMCQALQAEIRSVESVLAEVQRDLQHTQEHLQNLQEKSTQTYDEVHTLQVGLSDTNINLDKVSKELGRVGQATQQLQVSDQTTKETLTVLEESKKLVETRLEVITKDVLLGKETDQRLQDIVDRQINEDLRVLRKELANTNLTVNQTITEHKQTQMIGRENREALRDARVDIEKVLNEVKKANTVTNILENRLSSTAKGLQQSWSKCAELSDSMVKLAECYDKTKARALDNEGQIKEFVTFGQRTREELVQAVRQVEHNTDRLSQAMKKIDEAESATEDSRHQINNMKQVQQNSLRSFNALKGELNEVKQRQADIRGAIKEQSSMLLPNIHLDSAEAVNVSQRYGSLMASSTMGKGDSSGRPVSRHTPRSERGGMSKNQSWT